MTDLKPDEDTYGQEMWAWFQGEKICEVVERNDGYIEASMHGVAGYFQEYDDWPVFERQAITSAKGRVLDVGCGAGRHALHLQANGFEVLGVDSSRLAIKICKLRGVMNAKVMSIEQINFNPGSFDSIIMMGNNFGLFGSYRRARRLLKRFHSMTSPQGLIVASTRDPYKTENPHHLEYHQLNRRRGRMGGQLRIRVRFRKSVGRWFDYLMVSKTEMQAVLKGTGWKIREFIDSDDSEYIAVIEKSRPSSVAGLRGGTKRQRGKPQPTDRPKWQEMPNPERSPR